MHYGFNGIASMGGVPIGPVQAWSLGFVNHSRVWEQVGERVFPTCTCDDPLCENRPSIINNFGDWFADAKRRALGLPRTFIEVNQEAFTMESMKQIMQEDLKRAANEQMRKLEDEGFKIRFQAFDMPIVMPKFSMIANYAT